jgi:peptidoglycan hydrolase-like protein with peptidoglycan-binding domain
VAQFNVTDIISIAYKLLANKDEILASWTKIAPVVDQVMKALPDLKALYDKIAPSLGALPKNPYTVQWLQESLNKLANAGLTVDGSYGQRTKTAVENFQKQNGLTVDGWAGVATTGAILAALEQKK